MPDALRAFSLAGKTAIVTGGAVGMGLAFSELLADAGAAVVILDRVQKPLDEAVARVNARKPAQACRGLLCDVTSEAAVDSAFETACRGRRLDCLVNNAGVSSVGDVLGTSVAEFERTCSVNVRGVFLCLRAGIKRMLADGKGGSIVNLASIASLSAMENRFAYSASKGAVLTMTQSCAVDYVRRGIRVNCICPGRVHTPFVDGFIAKHNPGNEKAALKLAGDYQPMGRMAKPEEIAPLVLYLLSDASSFVTGSAYAIDGGCVRPARTTPAAP